MIQVILLRLQNDKDRTLGRLEIYKDLIHLGSFVTLELPDMNNARRISCIPSGTYTIQAENHPKFGHCFRVHNVRYRDGILIHAGNDPKDTEGCILPGMRFEDIDKDGKMEVTSSRQAIKMMWQMIPDTARMIVI